MARAHQTSGMEPIPRYTMPDRSVPEYDLILEELQEDIRSSIGESCFYIRQDEGAYFLCRIIHGGGHIYFHEIVDHLRHGISDEDIELSAEMDQCSFELPGHYHISALVEKKLRTLYDK